MSARDDLLNAMQDMVLTGHTFQIGPGPMINGVRCTIVNISGPSGSRHAVESDVHHALSDIFSQIALARLS